MASADAEAEAAEQQEIVKEYNIENDDPETLTKAREWDDWKDGRYLIDLCDILLCGSKGDWVSINVVAFCDKFLPGNGCKKLNFKS